MKKQKNRKQFKNIFNYYFDLWLSRGTVSMVILLFVITGVIVLLLALLIIILCSSRGINFIQAVWGTLTHTLDPGVLAGDEGSVVFLLIMLLATLCCVFFTALLIVGFFGVGSINGLIDFVGSQMNIFLSMVVSGTDFVAKAQEVFNSIDLSDFHFLAAGDITNLISGNAEHSKIALIIFSIGIAYGCIGAGITHIERYISYMLYLVLGPVCLGFNGADETKDTCKQWIVGIVTQATVIMMSLLLWRVLFNQLGQQWNMFNLAVCLAITSLIRTAKSFSIQSVSEPWLTRIRPGR